MPDLLSTATALHDAAVPLAQRRTRKRLRTLAPRAMRGGWGTGASPVLHRDRLYLVNDNEEHSCLLALEKRTGKELWRVERDEKTNWATPYVWDNPHRSEIVTAGSGKVRAYDLSGKLLWEAHLPFSACATPITYEIDGKQFVVIGAGVGGLTAAALLAKRGFDVTVLEAHVEPGGCAATFFHKGYRFDVGATLVGGFHPGGPHQPGGHGRRGTARRWTDRRWLRDLEKARGRREERSAGQGGGVAWRSLVGRR